MNAGEKCGKLISELPEEKKAEAKAIGDDLERGIK